MIPESRVAYTVPKNATADTFVGAYELTAEPPIQKLIITPTEEKQVFEEERVDGYKPVIVKSIQAVSENGIIGKAKESQTAYNQAQANEQAILQNYEDYITGKLENSINWEQILADATANPTLFTEVVGKVVIVVIVSISSFKSSITSLIVSQTEPIATINLFAFFEP